MFRTQVRVEEFGFIAAGPDGEVRAYGPAAGPALQAADFVSAAPHALTALPPDAGLVAPIFTSIELTLRCNLTCTHCYISADQPRPGELDTGELRDLLDRIADFGAFFTFFTGGEPTLRPDLAELIGHAESVGLDLNVLTNATGMSRRLFDRIPGHTTFIVSVDGIEAHQRIRGNQTFAQVARRIEATRAAGFPVVANATVNRQNLAELPALYDWAEAERLPLTSLDLYNVGRATAHAGLLYLDRDQTELYRRYIERKIEYDRLLPTLYQETFRPGRTYANPFYYSFAEQCIRDTGHNYQGNYYLYVASDGVTYPDNFYAGETLFPSGNVRMDSLADIWARAKRLVASSDYDKFNCSGCPIHEEGYFCDFKSAVQSRNATGSVNECGAYGVMKELALLRNRMQTERFGADGSIALRRWDNF